MYNVDTISLLLDFRIINSNFFTSNLKTIQYLDYKIKSKMYEVTDEITGEKRWIGKYNGYNLYYNSKWNALTSQIPHNKIEKLTADEILEIFKYSMMQLFQLKETEIPEIKLSRIDIKNDYLCKNEEELKIIKYIIQKVKDKFRNYEKTYKKDDTEGYSVKYLSHKKNKEGTEYDETLQSFKTFEIKLSDEVDETSGYIEYSFYDKEQETKFRIEKGEADETELEKYKNIFRSEVKIKNKRLNSYLFENKIMTKDLVTYYNKEMTEELYHKYMKQIIGPQDFYRIDVALSIIDDSNFRSNKKKKLKELLLLINTRGYGSSNEEWIERYSKATFYSHIRSIESLGINVITFPVKITGQSVKARKVKNFTLFKNGVTEV